MNTSVVSRVLDAGIKNACTVTYIMAGCRAVTCLLELGYRGLVDPALARLIKPSDEEGEGTTGNWSDTVFQWIDTRGELRGVKTLTLLKEAARYFVIAFAVKEITDRVFGQPVQGFNLIGRFVGLQVLPAGIQLPRLAEMGNFFNPMAV